eukprot:8980238-Alexandrium_andersonii.AAC.1
MLRPDSAPAHSHVAGADGSAAALGAAMVELRPGPENHEHALRCCRSRIPPTVWHSARMPSEHGASGVGGAGGHSGVAERRGSSPVPG